MLTAIKPGRDIVKNGVRRSTWVCQCDCGNLVVVRTDNLITSHTQSCGCLYGDANKCELNNASMRRLCTAILQQAMDDYADLVASKRRRNKEDGFTYSIQEIEKFFRSDYGDSITRFVADGHRVYLSDGKSYPITGEQALLAIKNK